MQKTRISHGVQLKQWHGLFPRQFKSVQRPALDKFMNTLLHIIELLVYHNLKVEEKYLEMFNHYENTRLKKKKNCKDRY